MARRRWNARRARYRRSPVKPSPLDMAKVLQTVQSAAQRPLRGARGGDGTERRENSLGRVVSSGWRRRAGPGRAEPSGAMKRFRTERCANSGQNAFSPSGLVFVGRKRSRKKKELQSLRTVLHLHTYNVCDICVPLYDRLRARNVKLYPNALKQRYPREHEQAHGAPGRTTEHLYFKHKGART